MEASREDKTKTEEKVGAEANVAATSTDEQKQEAHVGGRVQREGSKVEGTVEHKEEGKNKEDYEDGGYYDD